MPAGATQTERSEIARRMARNTGVQWLGDVVTKLASILLFAVLARELGVSALGEFTFALSLALLCLGFVDLGTDPLVARSVARTPGAAAALVRTSIVIKAVSGTVGLLVAVAVAVIGGQPAATTIALALLALATLLEAWSQTVYAVLQGLNDLRPMAVGLALQRLTTAAIGIPIVLIISTIESAACAYLIGATFGTAYAWRTLRAEGVEPRGRLQPSAIRRLLHESRSIAVADVFGVIYLRAGAISLAAISGAVAVGIYGAAFRLYEAILFVVWTLGGAALPALVQAHGISRPRLRTLFEGSMKAMVAVVFPIGVALVAYADPIVELIYGAEYVDSARPLQFLGLAFIAFGLTYLASDALITEGRTATMAWVTGACAVANLGLLIGLVPEFSADGAAAALAISEVLQAGLMTAFAALSIGRLDLRRVLAGPLMAAALMAGVAVVTGRRLETLALAVVAYLGALAILERWMNPADYAVARSILRRRGSAL